MEGELGFGVSLQISNFSLFLMDKKIFLWRARGSIRILFWAEREQDTLAILALVLEAGLRSRDRP